VVTGAVMGTADVLVRGARELSRGLAKLSFGAPVTHVYDPLQYAAEAHADYLKRYADGPKQVVYLGMNPGPFGMAQTGVPFGEVRLVRDFLGVRGRIGKPAPEHPERPILGFECPRSEVSGARLWGAIAQRHGKPEAFFARAFVANYCPLAFMEGSGKNRTPDKLPPRERAALYALCDEHLRLLVTTLQPKVVVGIGKFAEARAKIALEGVPVQIGSIPHPSPASPLANKGWAEQADKALAKLGLQL
jgi:single-strand selective monofunctional uracil DNA glycosylase